MLTKKLLITGALLACAVSHASAQSKETIKITTQIVETARKDTALGDKFLAQQIAWHLDHAEASKQTDDGVLAMFAEFADPRLTEAIMQGMAKISTESCVDAKIDGGTAWCELKARRAKEIYQVLDKARRK